MKIAFLNTVPALEKWMNSMYPDVTCYEEVTPELMAHSVIIICEFYKINEDYYQILDLWRLHPKLKNEGKKIIILGWGKHTPPNRISINSLKGNLLSWCEKAEPVEENPAYSELADQNICRPIEYILLSHGSNAFQAGLQRLMVNIQEVEEALADGQTMDKILESESGKLAYAEFHRVSWMWERAKPWFQLMPHFPELCRYIQIEQNVQKLLIQHDRTIQGLSVDIFKYIDEVITFITGIYKMDTETKKR